jgi:hypothetical protein
MPYGPASKGGKETAAYDAYMERCVISVMKGGNDKSSAIRICKVQWRKDHAKK